MIEIDEKTTLMAIAGIRTSIARKRQSLNRHKRKFEKEVDMCQHDRNGMILSITQRKNHIQDLEDAIELLTCNLYTGL